MDTKTTGVEQSAYLDFSSAQYKGNIENAKGTILKNNNFVKSQMKNRDMQIVQRQSFSCPLKLYLTNFQLHNFDILICRCMQKYNLETNNLIIDDTNIRRISNLNDCPSPSASLPLSYRFVAAFVPSENSQNKHWKLNSKRKCTTRKEIFFPISNSH